MSPTPSHSGPKTRGTDCGHRDFLPIRNAVKLYAIIMIAIVTAGIRDGCGVAFTHCSPDPGLRICHVFHYGSHIRISCPPAPWIAATAACAVMPTSLFRLKFTIGVRRNELKSIVQVLAELGMIKTRQISLKTLLEAPNQSFKTHLMSTL